MSRGGGLALGVAAWCALARAQAPSPTPPQQVAVFGLRAEGLESLQTTLVDVLVTEVANTGRFKVISQNEIQALLGLERLKDAVGCDDVSCMAEIGGALGVERIITGSVAKLGEAFVVNLQLVNVTYGTVENRVSMNWGGEALEVVNVIGAAAQDLVLPFKDKARGALSVTQLPEGAAVFVDNKPAAARVADLGIGPHVLKVTAAEHHDKITHFVIKSGQEVTLDGSLRRVERPPAPAEEVKDIALTGEFEYQYLTDSFTNDGSGQALVANIEGGYRWSRWLRAGLRVLLVTSASGTITSPEPWPNATQHGGGFGLGLVLGTSPLYRENKYDLAVELGISAQSRKLTQANFTLPAEYSISDQGNNSSDARRPVIGGHAGVTLDYYLVPALTVGVALRYYVVAAHTVRYNGEELSRSVSAVGATPRIAIRF